MSSPSRGEGSLIIAPWGAPASWRNVRYKLELEGGGAGRGEGGELEFCTTLPLLLRAYEGADVALVVLDSLVDEFRGQEQQSACYRCYDQLRSLVREAGRASSYSELREGVECFVEAYLGCLLQHASGVSPENVRAVVCPAVGRPGGSWSFEGRAADFEAVALYELGRLCAEQPYHRLILDLTHGINFMPALTLRLAERLAGVLLAAHAELAEQGVELLVYNSDPVTGSAPLRLNLVAKARIKSIPIPHELPGDLLKPREKVAEGGVQGVNKRYREAVKLTLSALVYPMPLVLCLSRGKAANSFAVLEDAYRLWLNSIVVDGQSVRRRLSLSPDGVYALLLSGSAAKRLEKLGLGYPAELAKLKELAELYRAVNESYYHLVMNELGRVEELLRETTAETKMLYELYGEQPRGKRFDKRVMIAHAGLQKEFVEVLEGRELKYTIEGSKLEEELKDSGLLITMQ